MSAEKSNIGIVIPCYNNGDTINRCLNSVKKAKVSLESQVLCVCINDNSIDQTLTIINQYKMQGVVDIVISNPSNLGVSSSRNLGIIECKKTDWICFLDADDVLSQSFPIVEQYLTSSVSQIIGSHFCNDGKSRTRPIHHLPYSKNLDESDCVTYVKKYLNQPNHFSLFTSCWARLYKTKTIINKQTIFFNEKMNTAEDADFSFRVLLKDPRCMYLREELYENYVSINHRSSHSAAFAVQRPMVNLFSFLWAVRSARNVIIKYSSPVRSKLKKEIHHCISCYLMVYYVRSTLGTNSLRQLLSRARKLFKYTECGYLRDCLEDYDVKKAKGSHFLAFLIKKRRKFLSYVFSLYLRRRRYG